MKKVQKIFKTNLFFFKALQRHQYFFVLGAIFCTTFANAVPESPTAEASFAVLPSGFVHLSILDPSIILDMRYRTHHNFIGRPIVGYHADTCILTTPAAEALKSVQAELKAVGFSLKVYDCYRPQRAVNDFVAWGKDIKDTLMKGAFYPTVEKANLFKDGYIAEKSGHSRGSTVDLAIVDLASLQPKPLKASSTASECNTSSAKRFPDNALDFGTGFDCFDQKSHTAYPNLTSIQKTHRLMLKSMMEKNGFKSLEEEWWHYTLRDEPFKDKYFDFPVE